ncbi:MAG: Ig-like domain-containing protein [Patescibacteria group bacterium]
MMANKTKKIAIGTGLMGIAAIGYLFVIGVIHPARAQINTDTPPQLVVYLESPDVSSATQAPIFGQTRFVIRFSGEGVSTITGVDVDAYVQGGLTRTLHCTNQSTDTLFRWSMYCDTLDLPNGRYQVGFRAHTPSGDAILMSPGSSTGLFGPLTVSNTFQITHPTAGSQVSGIIPVSFSASGDLAAARFSIEGSNQPVINMLRTGGQQYISSQWSAEWDSRNVSNGTNTILVSIQTRSGMQLENVALAPLSIYNTTCTAAWTCTDWIACSSAGIQTRVCSDGCGNTRTESQSCAVPAGPSTETPPATPTPTTGETASPPPGVPIVTLIQPGNGATISATALIRAEVSGEVSGVTMYYRSVDSPVEYRIGSATVSSTNDHIWARSWDTENVPDGGYFVYARAVNAAGQYGMSGVIGVSVANTSELVIGPDGSVSIPPSPPVENFTEPDADGDGTTDEEELLLGTAVHSPDTNADGTSDVAELFGTTSSSAAQSLARLVALGRLTQQQADAIRMRLEANVWEQPTTKGTLMPDLFTIARIENKTIGSHNAIVISGTGPANTYLTLYIYSNPIVVTTKTDAQGNFVYTLDSGLDDGKHEVYVTVTDDTGKIEEKSAPFAFFIRQAQAVSEDEYLRGDVNVSQTQDRSINNYLRMVAIIVLSLTAALAIGWLMKQRNKHSPA